MRALIICPQCDSDPVDCRLCEGAGTLCIDETEVKETDLVIHSDLPNAQTDK